MSESEKKEENGEERIENGKKDENIVETKSKEVNPQNECDKKNENDLPTVGDGKETSKTEEIESVIENPNVDDEILENEVEKDVPSETQPPPENEEIVDKEETLKSVEENGNSEPPKEIIENENDSKDNDLILSDEEQPDIEMSKAEIIKTSSNENLKIEPQEPNEIVKPESPSKKVAPPIPKTSPPKINTAPQRHTELIREKKENLFNKKKSKKDRRHTSAHRDPLDSSSSRSGRKKKKKSRLKRDEWMLPFNKIDIQYRIGSGGYGTVFRGKLQVGIGYIDVALKEMKKTQNRYDGVKAEVKLMEEVHLHPNILNCYGATFDPKTGNHYLITQFCSNGDLCSFYKKNIIENPKKLKYLIHLAKAFKFLHSKGIIHRDLKPENILISESMDVLLCDFGVSKHKERMSGTLIGSVEYLPPEYLDEKMKIVPTKIDIYSFGVIIYELFEEQKPFTEYLTENQQNQFHLLYLIKEKDKRPNVNGMKCSMPIGLKKLMTDCWDRDIYKRPRDFVEILKRLQKIYKDDKKKRREIKRKSKKIKRCENIDAQ